ncbi:ATP-binding protein [Candidatus Gottesmanbacteria bacterium]|nr:ATP-binding protein [Candidatus Gottesmanbacteria bacterium]
MENLDTLIYPQNPHWEKTPTVKPEKKWPKLRAYNKAVVWLDKHPIIALTGLRRTGKSTALLQIKDKLEGETPLKNIFYFSFEKSQVKFHPDSLREILYWYFDKIIKNIPQGLTERVYIFLDEVQYIPYWQDVLKTFYDQSQNIKFLISGSTSLFIKNKTLESLAGRIVEIIVTPLSFKEFWQIKGIKGKAENLIKSRPNYLNGIFEDYLNYGQFPEIVRENFTLDEAKEYLKSIEEKILDQDIPKIYPVQKVDILKLAYFYATINTGSIVEFNNLAPDLGTDQRTTAKYFDYLKEGYLLNFCLNQTKKPIRSARTGKKVYLESTNMATVSAPMKVENYVFNWLKAKGEVKFHRLKDFEVDFVLKSKEGILPVEVKYQEKIKPSDYGNLVKLAKVEKIGRAMLVSKNLKKTVEVGGITIDIVPAVLLR